MKRLFVLVLVMAFVMGFAGLAIADCDCYVYDNWQGVFDFPNTTYLEQGEYGEVILNYVKGQGSYIVNIDVYNLIENKTFEIYLLTDVHGPGSEQFLIGHLETDEYGSGHTNIRGLTPEEIALAGSNPRVVLFLDIEDWSWVVKTDDYLLLPVGSNRVKCEDCED